MPNYAQITLVGHLGKDAETRTFQNGNPITTFSIAVSEKYKDKQTTSWFNVTLFSDKLTKYLTKGKPIMVVGKPKMETWEKDGQKHTALKVIANEITFLGDGQRSEQKQEKSQQEQESEWGSDDVPF